MSFDYSAAVEYLRSLQRDPLPLPFNETTISGAKIQPTVGPLAAALLDVLIRSHRPSQILEIGTSYGYATCTMGRAAKEYGGKIITIEIQEELVRAARKNIADLGLERTVDVVHGNAMQVIGDLYGPFGLVLQDGHKEDYLPLLEMLVNRLEIGGLLISDDVLFPVMDLPTSVESWKQAMDAYNHELAAYPRLRTAWLAIEDGIAVSVKITE